jgi:predicted AAA+ superfamily ATPase
MIERFLNQKCLSLAKQFPILALIGPRQSGKTTLVKHLFSNYRYVSLEDLDLRQFATEDPRGFLNTYGNKVILDEVQRVPSLFSYLQSHVDKNTDTGQFILTGSENFLLSAHINQSLAGRVAHLTLLPCSLKELDQADYRPKNFFEAILKGGYPRLYDKDIAPEDWYPNYIRSYLEKDVRQLKAISDLSLFQLFLKMCAARIGQLLNLSALANDCGISHNTAKAWLSILEQSFIIFMLRPFHGNLGKRLTKTPKIYFYDTGIACSLLGLSDHALLEIHSMKGALFENMIVSECLKKDFNQGKIPAFYFWRDKTGHEVDLLQEKKETYVITEIKASQTFHKDYLKHLNYFQKHSDRACEFNIIYGGEESQQRSDYTLHSWKDAYNASLLPNTKTGKNTAE